MKVLVFDKIYVPGYGMGPFTTPIEMTDPREIAILKTKSRIKVMGDHIISAKKKSNAFPVKVLPPTETIEQAKPDYVDSHLNAELLDGQHAPVTEVKVETEPIVEAEVEVEPIVEAEVESIVEVEPIVEPSPVVVPAKKLSHADVDDLTIVELKALLDEKKIEYQYKDNKATLITNLLKHQ